MSYKFYTNTVAEFAKKFDAPKTEEFWIGLVEEEAKELIEAGEHLLKELSDFMYVNAGLVNAVETTGIEPTHRMSDNIADAFKFAAKVVDMFGDDVCEEAFCRVHESNMSKLGEDGKPVRREDGKILKGPNYQPPVLSDLI